MTFPRSIRTVLAVALFGLVQFGLVANARADLPSASTPAQNAITHGGAFCGLPQFEAFSAWSAPVNIGPTINTPYEESAPAISADGRSLYFNRNTNGADPAQPGKIDEDIFVSHRQNPNQPWGEPQLVKVLNTATFNERNVALSRDGKLLFFSSDRNAAGDLDLYVSKRVNGHHPPRTVVGADQPRHGGQQHGQRHRPRLLRGQARDRHPLLHEQQAWRPRTARHLREQAGGRRAGRHAHVRHACAGSQN